MSMKSLPRVILGLIFIIACTGKILDPLAFAEIVRNYQVLPEVMILPIAYFLPWLEFTCGAMLVCGVLTETATIIISSMLVLFIAVLSANLYRGLDVACGCFSTDGSLKSGMVTTIVRDVVLLVLAAMSYKFKKN
ncbi:MauE/DoxX family redox-associated membrane protein [Maridesulfovibrio frigidus]|uniref:MauE/DoxX family redox-associated membrane protein n=1 Tax=Maridesulfovibrio frigidus TaxID=340956 RepID=UPI0004E1A616|nr:MauE/DoxX family redox-associated membrane protein [Maridesulfovibrio frigidus]